MSSVLFSLPQLFEKYKKWVSSHPQLASDAETAAKWLSYIIVGRINNSTIVSELLYSLSNLLVLFNDRIISKARQIELPNSGQNLKLWLTVLDYCEVFLELTAKKYWGEAGRWLLIVSVQIFKCISRLFLLYVHKENIIENPPIPVLKRKTLQPGENYVSDFTLSDFKEAQLESMSFILKRSGKVVRKVEAAPPISSRNWKPLRSQNNNEVEETVEEALASRQKLAETVYIFKPIAHLGSVLLFGNNTWKPWTLSLLLDITSIHLYNNCLKIKKNSLSRKQQLNVSRRTLMLIMYLLRSPFYDKYSKNKVDAFLYALGRKIPLAAIICTPLAAYIPHWQKTYFYMWST